MAAADSVPRLFSQRTGEWAKNVPGRGAGGLGSGGGVEPTEVNAELGDKIYANI